MAKIPAFKILIAYETFDGALRVKEMLDRLAADLQPACKLQCEFWKFDLLSQPSFRAKAEADASGADMIIIAARGDADLVDGVKSWFESWLPRKQPGQAALVAILEDQVPVPGEIPRPCAYLQSAAARGSMDFFCQAGGWRPAELQYVVESVHREPETSLAFMLREPAPRDESLRDWGIND
jgi:hypothetical protein